MKFLKGLFLFLLIIILVGVVVSFFLPREVSVERSKVMTAPVGDVYDQVANLKNWESWNPWLKIDADVKTTYGDKLEGEGAWYSWSSENPNVGEGKLTITEVNPNKSLGTKLEFDGQNPGTGSWSFEETKEGTKVTWSMNSDMGYNPISRWFGVMLDGMVGPQFEAGLDGIEAAAKMKPAFVPEERTTGETIYVSRQAKGNVNTMTSDMFASNYGAIIGHLLSKGIELSGAPMAVYHDFQPNGDVTVDFAQPVAEAIEVPSDMSVNTIPAGKKLVAIHHGAYENIGSAWDNMKAYMETTGTQPKGSPYEVYVTDPESEPDTSKWVTEVIFPV